MQSCGIVSCRVSLGVTEGRGRDVRRESLIGGVVIVVTMVQATLPFVNQRIQRRGQQKIRVSNGRRCRCEVRQGKASTGRERRTASRIAKVSNLQSLMSDGPGVATLALVKPVTSTHCFSKGPAPLAAGFWGSLPLSSIHDGAAPLFPVPAHCAPLQLLSSPGLPLSGGPPVGLHPEWAVSLSAPTHSHL